MILRPEIYWAVAVGFVVTAVVVIVGGWIGCERGIHPKRLPEKYKVSEFDLPSPEIVQFESRDGLKIAGWFFPGTNGATVILVQNSRADMIPHADYLHRSGFSVLMLGFRYWESEGNVSTLGAREPWDIEGAVDYLKKRPGVDPERIGVQGISLGAASSILAAAETPMIKGVVAESAFKSVSSVIESSFEKVVGLPSFPFAPVSKFICKLRLGVDLDKVVPAKVIGKISPRPVFLIDDLKDELLPGDSAEVLYGAARKPKVLWQIPGCLHGKGWECAPKEYESRVLAFWRKTIGITQPHSRRSNICRDKASCPEI